MSQKRIPRVHQLAKEGNKVKSECGLEIYLHDLFMVKDLSNPNYRDIDEPFEVAPCKACLAKIKAKEE